MPLVSVKDPPIGHRRESVPHEVDLPHQLAPEGEGEVFIGQRLERLEPRLAGRAHDGVELPDPRVERANGRRIRDVHLLVRLFRLASTRFVPILERRDERLSDGARGTDDEDAHA